MTDINCTICSNSLTTYEQNYFNENELWYIKPHCQKHWCECMPQSTPYKWLIDCYVCDTIVCKSCIGDCSKRLCQVCYDCLKQGHRYK
jgi:hypothetical protein